MSLSGERGRKARAWPFSRISSPSLGNVSGKVAVGVNESELEPRVASVFTELCVGVSNSVISKCSRSWRKTERTISDVGQPPGERLDFR